MDASSARSAIGPVLDSTQRTVLTCEGVSKRFRPAAGAPVTAIDGLDLVVRAGEFVSIVGPSGCGKTTLLRILADLEPASTGSVTWTVANRAAEDRGDFRSVVFQEGGIFPWMTVLGNATFGLRAQGVPKQEREAKARTLLDRLGLGQFEAAYPDTLSGGMRQRVNLARAFVCEPEVFLMDEPLASLDEQVKIIIQEDLVRLWEGTDKTVIYITHSLEEAVAISDRIVVLSNRPSHVKADIRVPLSRPRDVAECRSDPLFVETRRQVWDALRSEVSVL